MAPRPATPDPDAPLTLRALERAIRASLPLDAPGIGGKTLAREIRAGRLHAARVGRWYRTTWRNYCAWLEAQRVQPAPDSPTPRGDAESWAAERVAREEQRSA